MKYRVSDCINRFQSSLWQLNSVHIHYSNTTCIIDPAYTPEELQEITESVVNPGWPDQYIGFTHGDYDHIVGIDWFENFTSIGSKAMDQRLDKERVVHQIIDFDEELYIARPYTPRFPELDLKQDIQDSAEIKIGDLNVHLYKAGGHTNDGLFYIFPDQKLWIAGDYLSDIEFPFIEDDIKEYYNTLDRALKIIANYEIDFMIPGHGDIAFTHREIHKRIDCSKKYLDSLRSSEVKDWQISWGPSPFGKFLDKMHQKNIAYVRSQNI